MDSTKKTTRVHIRWMIRRDMLDVVNIEAGAFSKDRWEEPDFLVELRQRNCIGMVAEHGETVVGFMMYELHKTYLKLINFAVDPRWWRLGVGRQMIEKLIGKLSSHRRVRITADISELNMVGLVFFRSLGFKASRIIYEGWRSSGRDAYRMEYKLDGADDIQESANRIAAFEND